jgi:subfamily B ATP-binding cassette protein MsbA
MVRVAKHFRPDTPRRVLKLCSPLKGLLFSALIFTALSSAIWVINISLMQFFIDDSIPLIAGRTEMVDIPESQIRSIQHSTESVIELSEDDIRSVILTVKQYKDREDLKIINLREKIPSLTNLSDSQIASVLRAVEDYKNRNLADRITSAIGKNLSVYNFMYLIMILFIFHGLTRGMGLYLSSKFGQAIVYNLREMIFNHLQELDLAFYEDKKTGGIMSYFTNDINVFRVFAAQLLNSFVENFILVIGALIGLFFISWPLALISFCVVPVLAYIINYAGNAVRKTTRIVQDKLSDISAFLQEVVSATQIIRSFGTESHEIKRFQRENIATYRAEMRKASITAFLQPVIQIVVAVGIFIILVNAINQLSTGELSTGQLIVFVGFLVLISERGKRLGHTYAEINELFSAADRVFEFTDEKVNIVEIENPTVFGDISGDVKFHNVHFSYDGKDKVLRNIDLEVPPGRIVAVVGPSGAGKSSLIKLLPRFYDIQDGEILVDGVNIKNASIKSLRAQMSIVPQQTILFSTSVKENISYGKFDASMDEIIDAAKAANAHDFIEKLPEGYNTIVGERGSKLSGGQAQRIAIARAILKNPRILILDEATSSLDAQSEELVQQALEKLMRGRTTFIIAHRLTTIHNAHEIIVLQNGEIVQRGNHDALMSVDGLYRNLYQVQVTEGNGI